MQSFLQTHEWAEFQKTLGRKVFTYDQGGVHALIIRHSLPFKKSYLYIPYGPRVDFHTMDSGLKNSIAQFFAHLRQLAQEQNAIFVKIEPRSDMTAELVYGQKRGFRYSQKRLQPHRTVILDLRQPEHDLMGGMHHKTRYNINLADRKGVSVEESNQFDTFWALLKKTTEHDGFSSHPRAYYEKLLEFFAPGRKLLLTTRLYLAYHDKIPVAGAIMLEYGNIVYYLHGASDREFRPLMAPHLMHWEMMKQYKARGFDYYDLWGIDAQRWPGVTRFKLGFGGKTVEYPGAFDMPMSRWWYWLYRIAHKIKKN